MRPTPRHTPDHAALSAVRDVPSSRLSPISTITAAPSTIPCVESQDRAHGAQDAGDQQQRGQRQHPGLGLWVYPLDALEVGEQVFVAEAGGWAAAARRAVYQWRRRTGNQLWRPGKREISTADAVVCGIRGVIIRRVL